MCSERLFELKEKEGRGILWQIGIEDSRWSHNDIYLPLDRTLLLTKNVSTQKLDLAYLLHWASFSPVSNHQTSPPYLPLPSLLVLLFFLSICFYLEEASHFQLWGRSALYNPQSTYIVPTIINVRRQSWRMYIFKNIVLWHCHGIGFSSSAICYISICCQNLTVSCKIQM